MFKTQSIISDIISIVFLKIMKNSNISITKHIILDTLKFIQILHKCKYFCLYFYLLSVVLI